MQKIGSLLAVVELGRLSCTSKSLHTLTTQHLWSFQFSFLTSSPEAKLRIKNEFFTIYETCSELFVKIFGVKSLLKMTVEEKELLTKSPHFSITPRLRAIFKTEKFIRGLAFEAFMFPCLFRKKSSFVAISTHEIPNALKFYFFHNSIGCVEEMHSLFLTPKTESDLKAFFKTGSLNFPTGFGDDDGNFEYIPLQLPSDVLAFFK
jgi:hypothetical protein